MQKVAIAWTTGEQQADRYDMRRTVDTLEWFQESKDSKSGYLRGYMNEDRLIDKAMNENELADFIGKSLAQKLLEQERTENKTAYGFVKCEL